MSHEDGRATPDTRAALSVVVGMIDVGGAYIRRALTGSHGMTSRSMWRGPDTPMCCSPSVHVLRQEGGRSRLYGLLNGDGQVEEKKQEGEGGPLPYTRHTKSARLCCPGA